jgi:RimJ/RimL family protein N-acetyltransferase
MKLALPYRIVTGRLVLRCWEPQDAAPLKEAVDESVDHLLPWMPWAADEPQTVEEKAELLRTFRGNFDLGVDFVYGIFDRDEAEVLGGTGLHTRIGPDALEIGYWIRASRAGEGLTTEATSALTRIAFELTDRERVEIRCDPANERSRAIPRKLAYVEEATLRHRLHYPEPRDVVVYSLFREDFPSSPAAKAVLEAYDVLGNRVL